MDLQNAIPGEQPQGPFCKLRIELHGATKNAPEFQKLKRIYVSKRAVLKHGFLTEDPPDYIAANDFDYFQSEFPNFEAQYNKYVQIDGTRILNRAPGETTKKISEIIGVGCGLIYATKLLQADIRSVTKIPPPEKKVKYMDFEIPCDRGTAYFEAKGTINDTSVSRMIGDIDEKKKLSVAPVKFGTVTVARKAADPNASVLYVEDDPPEVGHQRHGRGSQHQRLRQIISHYISYLSLILDSSAYNRFIRQFRRIESVAPPVSVRRIPQRLHRRDVEYVGEFFDHRLISERIRELHRPEMSLDRLFKQLTSNFGRRKLFLGIDSRVIDMYNGRKLDELLAYTHEPIDFDIQRGFDFVDRDGVTIIKSVDGSDARIDEAFTEAEVRQRLGYYVNYIRQEPAPCGASCRGHGIEGKACENVTYRGRCHFHR